jgi:hypothetical protein
MIENKGALLMMIPLGIYLIFIGRDGIKTGKFRGIKFHTELTARNVGKLSLLTGIMFIFPIFLSLISEILSVYVLCASGLLFGILILIVNFTNMRNKA